MGSRTTPYGFSLAAATSARHRKGHSSHDGHKTRKRTRVGEGLPVSASHRRSRTRPGNAVGGAARHQPMARRSLSGSPQFCSLSSNWQIHRGDRPGGRTSRHRPAGVANAGAAQLPGLVHAAHRNDVINEAGRCARDQRTRVRRTAEASISLLRSAVDRRDVGRVGRNAGRCLPTCHRGGWRRGRWDRSARQCAAGTRAVYQAVTIRITASPQQVLPLRTMRAGVCGISTLDQMPRQRSG